MDKNAIEELIAKYNEGLADPAEVLQLEKLIEEGKVEFTQLHELTKLDERVDKITEPIPSQELDYNFYEMLAKEKKTKMKTSFSWSWITDSIYSRITVGALLLAIGFGAGLTMQKKSSNNDVKELAQEVSSLKEMMMISLLEKEEATDRLKAVSMTEEIQPSKKVVDALLQTLNADPSVNVRLASLEALQNYSKSPKVCEGLVRSIAQQESPLVQMALAEAMVKLQEKSSIKELKKIIEQKTTPKEVKQRIEESINVLI